MPAHPMFPTQQYEPRTLYSAHDLRATTLGVSPSATSIAVLRGERE